MDSTFLNKGLPALHIAGIVPVCGQENNFNMPWHDSLMPLAPDYTAVEKAVFECAAIGCDTIWVVANRDIAPLIKQRIGEFIYDPYIKERKRFYLRKEIPIYFVPIHPKDRWKRDSLGWSVLYGAKVSYSTSAFISKWTAPELFYCSFPYSLNDVYEIKQKRHIITDKKKVIFSYNNKTVKDNKYINFTFDSKDYFSCKNYLLKTEKVFRNLYSMEKNNTQISTAFNELDIDNGVNVELSWHYNLSSWDEYRQFLNTDHAKNLKKPYNFLSKNKKNIYLGDSNKNIDE